MKRYSTFAFIYMILALTGGVFYREFTKFHNFTGKTTLSVIHTHYFVLGMFFFLLLLVLEKNFSFSTKNTKWILIAYHIGLNLTQIMFLVRGITQVLTCDLPSSVTASISGIAGIGHLILSGSMILLFVQIHRSIKNI